MTPDPLHLSDRARTLLDYALSTDRADAQEAIRRALDRAHRAGWFHARDDLLSAVYGALQRAETAEFGEDEPPQTPREGTLRP